MAGALITGQVGIDHVGSEAGRSW